MLLDLFTDVMNHFIKLGLVDAIKEFKDIIPRKKKQALRSKVTALGDRVETKQTVETKKKSSDKLQPRKKRKPSQTSSNDPSTSYSETDTYVCNLCSEECNWDPTDIALQSIACDKCNLWYHYGCVEIKGDEPFLFKKNLRWVCQTCKPTAKSKGKGKGKGKGKK